ncbi:MAG: penicillin-binding protein 1A [Alphaproteobacteria bacterium]|nr:penicillin-binding protein 1A [Alphaproteobacteria bacterium]
MIRFLVVFFSLVLLLVMAAGGGGLYVLWRFGRDLPDYSQLADYRPAVMSRVHAGDGTLIAEFAHERRLFVPIAAMPRQVIRAFLSAEDKTFYSHPGIDFAGIASALLRNIQNLGGKRRPVGASTITQQVAKNFLLTNEVSLARKIKEAILAFRIEHAFSKDRILELYLNEIYLGQGSYGVAAAALNYFDKSLDELNLEETAYLAALPKAPNNYHPIRNRKAAEGRRNWVLGQMAENGVISALDARRASSRALLMRRPDPTRILEAGFFAEEVRRELVKKYGDERLYEDGLSVRTTLEPALQTIADSELRAGLEAYDRRHGWRGPLTRIKDTENWMAALAKVPIPPAIGSWYMAVVLALHPDRAEIGSSNGVEGQILLQHLAWARAWRKGENRGPRVRRPDNVLAVGDVVAVAAVAKDDEDYQPGSYSLRQIPAINGALVAMDPHTGRVLAMTGGYNYRASQFNRATQAKRQPGSAFKPFVYAAALEHGFTPSSLVLDTPFVIDAGAGQGKWKPANYTKRFYGPSTLRLGIEKSRNLMTVRLANYIGMERVVDYAARFGIMADMPPLLPMSLGAGETTLLRLTTAYAMLVNGGKRVAPTLIDRIQDRRGRTVFRHDQRECPGCVSSGWHEQTVPVVPDVRAQIVEPGTAYQVVSMLEGVVQRGTGIRIKAVGKPLAGKTGTTNKSRDTWFIGFSPDLAVGVYIGFDNPRSLGRRETGSSVAVPVFRDFMARALADQPAIPFRIPAGIQLVRIAGNTGMPAQPGDLRVVLEAFKPGTVPKISGPVLDGTQAAQAISRGKRAGTGGLY